MIRILLLMCSFLQVEGRPFSGPLGEGMTSICKTYYFDNDGQLKHHVHAHVDIRYPEELTPLWLHNTGCLRFYYPPTMEQPAVKVHMKSQAGPFTMPVRDNITFTMGDGVDDTEVQFYGMMDNINACIKNIHKEPYSPGHWYCFFIRVDYMDEYINNPPIIHIPPDMRHLGNEGIDINTPTTDEYID